jgi:hypothetical protein
MISLTNDKKSNKNDVKSDNKRLRKKNRGGIQYKYKLIF